MVNVNDYIIPLWQFMLYAKSPVRHELVWDSKKGALVIKQNTIIEVKND